MAPRRVIMKVSTPTPTPTPTAIARLRALALTAVIIAVAAAGVAVWAVARTLTGDRTVTVTAYETASDGHGAGDSREELCSDFGLVRDAVGMRTNADPGSDPVVKEAVAANARLAAIGGGEYLRSRLGPATPSGLATAVRSFADELGRLGMYQLAGMPTSDRRVAELLSSIQSGGRTISGMCAGISP